MKSSFIIKNFLIFTLFLECYSSVYAADISWQGQIGQGYFYSNNLQKNSNKSSVLNSQTFADLQIKDVFNINNSSDFLILLHPEIQWNWESSFLEDSQINKDIWSIREAYLKYVNENFKLMTGKSIISWGSSDILNPVDFFGARDYNLLSAQSEKNRKGISSLRLFYNQNISNDSKNSLSYQLESVFAFSEIQNSRFNNTKIDWGSQVIEMTPKNNNNSLSFGIKTGLLTDTWDWSVFLYSGQSRNPEMQILDLNTFPIQIGSIYQNLKALGTDINYSINKWIFRGEASYKQYQIIAGQENLKSPDLSEIVIGVEHPIGDHLQIQVQIYQRTQFNYPENNLDLTKPIDNLTYSLQIYNDQSNGFISNTEYGWTIRMNALFFDDRLDLQNILMSFQESEAYFLRSSAKWTGFKNFNLTVGSIQYFADDSTPIGPMKKMNHLFTEISYLF